MKILISGGGIAGLTAYIALKQAGHELTLIEKRNNFEPKGAGIMLGINAMLMFQKLGLEQQIIEAGRVLNAISLENEQGVSMGSIDFSALAEKYAMPLLAIERSRLHAILESRLDPNDLIFKTSIVEIQKGEKSHRVKLSNLSESDYDLVIVAEGIHSTTRELLNGANPYRFSGYSCWRMLLDCETGDELIEMWGQGERFGIVPVGANRTYVFLTKNAREKDEQYAQLSSIDLKKIFKGFGHKAHLAMHAMDENTTVMYDDLVDYKSLLFEKDGVVFIGDASHAMTPNMGQGAGMGIEDALMLSELIEKEPEHFRKAYAAKRHKRVAKIHQTSYSNGVVSQLENSWACKIRNALMKLLPSSLMTRQMETQIIKPIIRL